MPEEARLVVVNTTPIIALSLIGELDLLRPLYGQVLAPPSGEAEQIAGPGQTMQVHRRIMPRGCGTGRSAMNLFVGVEKSYEEVYMARAGSR